MSLSYVAIKTQVVWFQHGKVDICLQWDLSCCILGSVPAGAAQCDGIGYKDKQTVPGVSCWTTVLRLAEVPEESHVTSERNHCLSPQPDKEDSLECRTPSVPWCLCDDPVNHYAWSENVVRNQISPVGTHLGENVQHPCIGGCHRGQQPARCLMFWWKMNCSAADEE